VDKNFVASMHEPEAEPVILRLPSTLSTYSGGKSQISLEATTLDELLAELARQHPHIWERLCTAEGRIRSHVKIFVNNSLVTSEDELNIALNPGQEVIVLPATT
jgi:sulfur-carrier protein